MSRGSSEGSLDEERLEERILSILAQSPVSTEVAHAERVRYYVLQLKPDAEYALQIAALSHDIERGVPPRVGGENKEKFVDYDAHKREHSERSAAIISGLLGEQGFKHPFIVAVHHYVLHHEFGGDPDTDVLKDADSLSFFDENLSWYLAHHGEATTRKKIRFMYNRMGECAKTLLRGKTYDDPTLHTIFREEVDARKNEP